MSGVLGVGWGGVVGDSLQKTFQSGFQKSRNFIVTKNIRNICSEEDSKYQPQIKNYEGHRGHAVTNQPMHSKVIDTKFLRIKYYT